jgi:hypothetical protein
MKAWTLRRSMKKLEDDTNERPRKLRMFPGLRMMGRMPFTTLPERKAPSKVFTTAWT